MLICNRALSVTNQVEYDQQVLASYKLLNKQELEELLTTRERGLIRECPQKEPQTNL